MPAQTPTRGAWTATHAVLALTVLLWSSNFIIGRAVRDDVSPATLAFPLFGAVLAMVFLGEQPAGYHVAGALLVLCGVVLSNRA